MKFEWDENKNRENIKKHEISFQIAKTIFLRNTVDYEDDRYDYGELRYIALGLLANGVVISVAYTERNNTIRIISARKATKKEQQIYYEYAR